MKGIYVFLIVLACSPCIAVSQDTPWLENNYCLDKADAFLDNKISKVIKSPKKYEGSIVSVRGLVVDAYDRKEYAVIELIPDKTGRYNPLRITIFQDISGGSIEKVLDYYDDGKVALKGEVSIFRGSAQIIVNRYCQIGKISAK